MVSRGLLKRSTTQLNQVKANIMGVVLNGMKPEISPDFQDFKYYKYYYGPAADKDVKRPGHDRGFFNFFRRLGKGEGSTLQNSPWGAEEGPRPTGREGRSKSARTSLIIIGLLLLVVGILWQNGIIDPFKYIGRGMTSKSARDKSTAQENLSQNTVNGAKDLEPTLKEIPKQEKRPDTVQTSDSPETGTSMQKKGITDFGNEPERDKETPSGETEETVSFNTPSSPGTQAEVKTGERVLPESKILYPHSIYLGAYRTVERAMKAVAITREMGLLSYWVKVHLGPKGQWFRVYTGFFSDAAGAHRFAEEKALKDYSVKETQFAVKIDGHITDRLVLQDKLSHLQELGYSSYIIDDGRGRPRLYVGAFLTRVGARSLQQELGSKGITGEVVNR
jgi:hypothetical protein